MSCLIDGFSDNVVNNIMLLTIFTIFFEFFINSNISSNIFSNISFDMNHLLHSSLLITSALNNWSKCTFFLYAIFTNTSFKTNPFTVNGLFRVKMVERNFTKVYDDSVFCSSYNNNFSIVYCEIYIGISIRVSFVV